MNLLMEVYGIGDKHPQYRFKLKNRLFNTFGDKLTFLSPDYRSAQIVISSKCFQEQNLSSFMSDEPDKLLTKAVNCLRTSVIENNKSIMKLSWPPTVQLNHEQRDVYYLVITLVILLVRGNGTLSDQLLMI